MQLASIVDMQSIFHLECECVHVFLHAEQVCAKIASSIVNLGDVTYFSDKLP